MIRFGDPLGWRVSPEDFTDSILYKITLTFALECDSWSIDVMENKVVQERFRAWAKEKHDIDITFQYWTDELCYIDIEETPALTAFLIGHTHGFTSY